MSAVDMSPDRSAVLLVIPAPICHRHAMVAGSLEWNVNERTGETDTVCNNDQAVLTRFEPVDS